MWVAVIGGELSCKREPTNKEDRFAVAVTKVSSQFEVAIQSIHRDSGMDICTPTHHSTGEQLLLTCRI